MSTRPYFGIALAILLVFAPSGRARAASIVAGTFPFSVTASLTPVTLMENIPAFDPSLGTLTQVQLAFNATETFEPVSFENRQNFPIQFGYFADIFFTLAVPGFTSTPFNPAPPPPNNFLSAFDGQADFQGPDSVTLSFGFTSYRDTRNYGGSFLTNPFLGTGDIPATLGISQDFLFSVSPNGANDPAFQINTFGTIAGTLTVTYTYDAAVPEPPGSVLLSLGVLGVVALGSHWRRAMF